MAVLLLNGIDWMCPSFFENGIPYIQYRVKFQIYGIDGEIQLQTFKSFL